MILTLMEVDSMVRQVPYRNSLNILLITFCFSCTGDQNVKMHSLNQKEVELSQVRGILYANEQVFSGTLYTLYENSTDTLSVRSFLDGKEHGTWKKFFSDGNLEESRHFMNGKKVDIYDAWWSNGQQKLSYQFLNDEYNGTNSEWNMTGLLISEMNYKMGHEEGPQKVWYDNGKIKSNYVVKNGRRYGLLGTKNCVNAADSISIY